MDVQFCRPDNDKYIIVESLYSSDIFRVSELAQVHRQIIGLCNFEEYAFDGQPLSGVPSTIQYIKDFVSRRRRITMHPTEKNGLYYVYRGVRNSLRPVSNLHIDGALAGRLSKSYNIPVRPVSMGRDPIPNVQLSLRGDIHFIMPGNQPPPTAFAIYDTNTRVLSEVTSLADRREILRGLAESSN